MFTGIIEALGHLSRRQVTGGDARVSIQCPTLDLGDVVPGDSIAVNGVCLTVTVLQDDGFDADVSTESLQRSCLGELPLGSVVNLEKALTPSSRMGGHLVTGHVDGIGVVRLRQPRGRGLHFAIEAPAGILRYIAEKGSIALDGVSLTVNGVSDDAFELLVIPHTLGATIIPDYAVGRRVHLEVDIMARYAERLMQLQGSDGVPEADRGLTMEKLARSGFLG